MRATGWGLTLLLASPVWAEEPSPASLRMFKGKCAGCHGADGKSETDQGKKLGIRPMASPAWQAAHTDAQLSEILSTNKPVKSNGKETEHFATKLKPADVTGLISVLRSFK